MLCLIFYRSKNVAGQSKFFDPDQKFNLFSLSATPKLVVPAQKLLYSVEICGFAIPILRIYYLSTFLGFWTPLSKDVCTFSTKNKQKLALSDPQTKLFEQIWFDTNN